MPNKLEVLLSQLQEQIEPAQRLQLLNDLSEEYADIDYLKAFETAEEMYQLALSHNIDHFVAQALSQKAWLHTSFGNVHESFAFVSQAQRIYTRLGDEKGLAQTSLHASAVLRRLGDYPGALEEALTALDLYQTYRDRQGVAETMARLSYLYVHLGDYEQAEIYGLKAYSEFEVIKGSGGIYKFSIPNSLAMAYFHQNKPIEAMNIFLREVEFLRRQNNKSDLGVALNNLGTVLLELDRLAEAEELVAEALLLDVETNHRYGEINCLFTLGEIEEKKKNYEGAILYYSQSLEKAIANHVEQIVYELHDRLAVVYECVGQVEMAFDHLKKYRKIREPLFKTESLDRIRGLRIVHETKQAIEEARRNAEVVSQRNREIELLQKTLTTTSTYPERRHILDVVCMEMLSTLKSTLSMAITIDSDQQHGTIEAGFHGDNKLDLLDLKLSELIDRDSQLVINILDSGRIEMIRDVDSYFGSTSRLAAVVKKMGISSLIAMPIIVDKRTVMVLVVGFDTKREFTDADINLATTLAASLSQIFENAHLYQSLVAAHDTLSKAYDATIEGWAKILELHDLETEGHARRVTEQTIKLAQAFGVSNDEIIHIRRGALLHDIGKLGIPDQIILKNGSLTEEEWEIMRKHPQFAYEMLANIEYLKPALEIPYCHHEKWDGSGYPQGLRGEQIPLAARLFSVVDVWDALRSDRPYRKGWSDEEVYEYIRSLSGKQFDPKAMEAFLTMMGQ
ncbi:MAG: tetratricopeptide repeat protein [Anaerolineales bacterium]|uniref:HD domain-containing phosphohydrolase n=1 Tax=Candidatus Villigracilis vicinus TaxID=3140679 RepID=UPI0031350C47|nr:tetratricopeptide repeat protein [Anaerolineales bacterium]